MHIPILNIEIGRSKKTLEKTDPIRDRIVVSPPISRSSEYDLPNLFQDFTTAGNAMLTPNAAVQYIETVRKAYPFIQNLSLAIWDLVQLTNTGHEIIFDNETDTELVNEMRECLTEDAKFWMDGAASIDSLINKWTSQIYVGGALSCEWVPKKDLSGIDYNVLVNPETIRWVLNKATGRFEPYQQLKHTPIGASKGDMQNLIKLNQTTYKYYGIGGDTAEPYGIPPFVSALEDLGIQRDMVKNIAFIIKQIGLMGFVKLMIEKPAQNKNENDTAYAARLQKLLSDSKRAISEGTKEGVLVGFQGDHEYDFQSTTQNVSGLSDVFAVNQNLVANGLKYSNSFMGVSQGAETNITVIFTKMLSQLKNVQSIVAANLEFGYILNLRLRGYKFKHLKVRFNPSTITDDLKLKQAEEINIRNSRVLYADGIIDIDEYARRTGYEEADQDEPRAPIDPDGMLAKEAQDQKREKDKTASESKTREKKKTKSS